jgi:hypothetical protein
MAESRRRLRRETYNECSAQPNSTQPKVVAVLIRIKMAKQKLSIGQKKIGRKTLKSLRMIGKAPFD